MPECPASNHTFIQIHSEINDGDYFKLCAAAASVFLHSCMGSGESDLRTLFTPQSFLLSGANISSALDERVWDNSPSPGIRGLPKFLSVWILVDRGLPAIS